ncbi:hypothetical protein [Vibrio mediterranei]|uniref:hypothetical protein n=1 Tax=Vibrio mediterranei TaxID=689 RepID=UPI004068F67F
MLYTEDKLALALAKAAIYEGQAKVSITPNADGDLELKIDGHHIATSVAPMNTYSDLADVIIGLGNEASLCAQYLTRDGWNCQPGANPPAFESLTKVKYCAGTELTTEDGTTIVDHDMSEVNSEGTALICDNTQIACWTVYGFTKDEEWEALHECRTQEHAECITEFVETQLS